MKKFIKRALSVAVSVALLCTAITISPLAAPKAKKLKLSKQKIVMEVGESLTLRSKGKASVNAKITPKKADKAITVKSGDSDVVKVKRLNKYSYRLTAVEEGNVNLTVFSKNNKKIKQKLRIKVIEPGENKSGFYMTVAQSAENKVMVNFNKEVPSTISTDKFNLKDKTLNIDFQLKNLTLFGDKKSVELESIMNFNKGNVYELSYTNPEDNRLYTATFTVSAGTTPSQPSATEASIVDWSFCQTSSPVDWSKPNNPTEKTIASDTADMKFEVKVKAADGKIFTSNDNPANFVFKPTNEAVYTMAGNKIAPRAKGAAKLMVEFTDANGKTSKFTPVTVTIGDKAEHKKIVLSQYSVNVALGNIDKTIKLLRVEDQYGNEFDMTGGSTSFVPANHINQPGLWGITPRVTLIEGNIVQIDTTNPPLVLKKTHDILGVFEKAGKGIKVNLEVTVN